MQFTQLKPSNETRTQELFQLGSHLFFFPWSKINKKNKNKICWNISGRFSYDHTPNLIEEDKEPEELKKN